MCEKTYNTASDVDACTSGCNATLSSDLSISLELVSILTLMDTLANQAYHILLPLSFTNSEITVITVFTSEQVRVMYGFAFVYVFKCSLCRSLVNGKHCRMLVMLSVCCQYIVHIA